MDNVQHATDDLLKIIHSLICILKADARTYPEASMTVFKKLKVQNVKCVQMKESEYPKTNVFVERHIYQPFLRGGLFRACDT